MTTNKEALATANGNEGKPEKLPKITTETPELQAASFNAEVEKLWQWKERLDQESGVSATLDLLDLNGKQQA